MTCRIIQGDCVEKLRELPEASVELFITSPPYGQLREYGGNLQWDFKSLAKEIFRVLAPGGVLCWNVGDEVIDGSESLEPFRQALCFKDEVGFRMHDTMIWHKANFSAPSSNRYHQVMEHVFILTKGSPRCFNPLKDKPNVWAGTGTFGKNTIRVGDDRMEERTRNIITEFGMRGNVWYGNTRGQEDVCEKLPHPAMMPKWLARDLIISWSNRGDTVCDVMAGSGTVGREAMHLGRSAIMIEKNPDYIPIIEETCTTYFGMV